jgi:PPP family 3-phenylpropionic acid transporter
VVLIAIVGTSLRMFLYSINTLPNNVILIEMMNGITWTLLWIASVEFVNETIPVKWRSTGQSLLWASYFGAGSILGNIISGRLYQHMVMREVYLLNGIAIGMLALVSGYFLVMKNNRQGRYRDIKEQIRN